MLLDSYGNSIFEWYELDDDLLQEIEQFAQQSNNNYSKRNQTDSHRINLQIISGKMFEWTCYYRLKPFFVELTSPDMHLYSPEEKNWNSDLCANDTIYFACKACDIRSIQAFSMSWIFQWQSNDGFGQDEEIFGENQKDIICLLGEVSNDYRKGRIRSIVPLSFLHDNNLFDEPKKQDKQGYKKTVYYAALQILGFGTNKIHQSVNQLIEKC